MLKKSINRSLACSTLALLIAGCGGESEPRIVDASEKESMNLGSVPAEVLAVATAAQPDLAISEAEFLTRDGNEYYDVGGTLPDGSEWELDITKIHGVWTVVEIQRDIGMELVPAAVGGVLETKFPGWSANRIIESDQGGGVIVYEFFGKDDDGNDTKIEVKWAESHAELLIDEWVH